MTVDQLVRRLVVAVLAPALGQHVLFVRFQHRDLPDFFQITGDAGFGRHPLIRGRQPNHELHHIVRTGVIAALNYFRTKLSAATPIVNLVSKRY